MRDILCRDNELNIWRNYSLSRACLNSAAARNTTAAGATVKVRLVYQTCAYVGLFHDRVQKKNLMFNLAVLLRGQEN